MTSLIVFDDGKGRLGPMTDLRSACEVRTGAFTTLERIEIATGLDCELLLVAEEMEGVAGERNACEVNGAAPSGEALAVSGRCVLPPAELAELQSGEALLEKETGDLVAVALGAEQVADFMRTVAPPAGVRTRRIDNACLARHPEDVIRHRDAALDFDLAALLSDEDAEAAALEGVTVIGGHDIRVDPGATVFPGAIIDAGAGPVVIASDAVVRPGCILMGPCYLGSQSAALERAHIKPHTAIGPVCKVNGEVGGTIFQGFANKGHDGHLGDAWVGEWVNFGAGTTNSNLLNTYGPVTIRSAVDEPRRRTGLTFLGCIVGDHVKFAIGTRIMTGAVFGTGAMVALTGAAPAFVDRFSWLTDAGPQLYRLDKFTDVMRAVMSRRDIDVSPAYAARLEALHAEVARQTMRGH